MVGFWKNVGVLWTLLIALTLRPSCLYAGVPSCVRFDAALEISMPRSSTHEVIFLRYWVKSNSYKAEVLWAEPQGRRLRFPVYPPGLVVNSSVSNFSISHLFSGLRTNMPKGSEHRGAFQYRYQDYPIANLFFADQESTESRVWKDKLHPFLIDRGNKGSQVFTNFQSSSRIRIHDRGALVDQMEILGSQTNVIQALAYEYYREESTNSISYLKKLTTLMPEQIIQAELKGNGARVRINNSEYLVKHFPLIHRKGSRMSTVTYNLVTNNLDILSVPTRISVETGDSNLLRSATLYNFRFMADKAAEADSSELVSMTPELEAFLKSCSPLERGKRPKDLWRTDQARLRLLRTNLVSTLPFEKNPALLLRNVSLLITIQQLLADNESDLGRFCKLYFHTLTQQGYTNVLLGAGVGLLEFSQSTQSLTNANVISKEWIPIVHANCDFPSVATFTLKELDRGNFNAVFKLLESATDLTPAGRRYEVTAIKALATKRLLSLMGVDRLKRSPAQQFQVELAAMTRDEQSLGLDLESAVQKLRELRAAIHDSTPLQKELERRTQILYSSRVNPK